MIGIGSSMMNDDLSQFLKSNLIRSHIRPQGEQLGRRSPLELLAKAGGEAGAVLIPLSCLAPTNLLSSDHTVDNLGSDDHNFMSAVCG